MKKEFDLIKSPLEGVSLIEASAGTGKTFTIVGVFLRLLLEKQVPIEKILVVTFTEAATAELKQRVGEKIREAFDAFQTGKTEDPFLLHLLNNFSSHHQALQHLKNALHLFDEACIYTIHGFCQKMLTDFAFDTGSLFDSELIPNQDPLLEELAMDYWRNLIYNASEEDTRLLLRHCPNPEYLKKTLKKIISRPEIHFLPATQKSSVQLIKQMKALFQKMKLTWLESQGEIATLLEEHKIWRKNNLSDYLSKAELYFLNDNFFDNPEILDKFAATTIRGRIKEKAGPIHLFFDQCDEFLKLERTLPHAIRIKFTEWAKTQLKQRKETLNQRSYDDLLQDLDQALTGAEGVTLAKKISTRYSAAMIDEFQDTDPTQYDIFWKIFCDSNLFFIGDPKQSIYSFRGADVFAYLQAQKEAKTQFTLETNWRSDCKLVEAVNTAFSSTEHAFANEEIKFFPSKGAPGKENSSLQIEGEVSVPMHFWYLEHQETVNIHKARQKIAEGTVSEITRLLNLGAQGKAKIVSEGKSKPVEPGDIAILTRTHSQAELLGKLLQQKHVPSVLKTQINIFQTEEFKDVLTIARAISEFSNPSLVKAALLSNILGYSGTLIFQIMEQELKWESIIHDFFAYRETWKTNGFYQMMRLLLRKEKVRTRLLARHDGERRLTNVLHVMELFHQEENRKKLGMAGLLRWAQAIQKDLPESRDEHLIRLETDAEALKILTVHASKGLEFPIVFCPFLWDGNHSTDTLFHHEKKGLIWHFDAQEADKEAAKKERLSEDIRLAYVALTRAKYRCYATCYAAWKSSHWRKSSPLAHLFSRGATWQHLEMLASRSHGSILAKILPSSENSVFKPSSTKTKDLNLKIFKQSLKQNWGISSFSGLSGQRIAHSEEPDHDQHLNSDPHEEGRADEEENISISSIFTLPKGANTGVCIHEILEELDFGETDQSKVNKLVQEKLKKYNIDSKWESVVSQMTEEVRQQKINSVHLPGQFFTLKDIPPNQVLKEMPFHFPIQPFHTDDMVKTVIQNRRTKNHDALLCSLQSLNFQALQGFMKGFLDLVFCFKDRYYILDWKTNHLGMHPEDYAVKRLKANIEAHAYNLQYIIYSLALHKYLRMRLPGYDFHHHFGGVYYFFVRGLQSGTDNRYGVYHDGLLDSKEMMEQLELCFSGEMHDFRR
ncbi:MAG: exodeoxyribonuclease V subunit beta [SAR324 cluster bacterium]|nr:exodeoxyribonuclease V subunit beta [SAR324 cluster bacterium]